MTKKVLMLVTDGVEEIEALMARDVFIRSGIEVDMMGLDEKDKIISSHKLSIDVLPLNLNDLNYDALIIPGGKTGTNNIDNFAHIDELIKHFYQNDKLIAAICAAPSILGKRGYLKNHSYTCYPGWEKEEYGQYTGKGVERSGRFITGKSMYYTADFALEIVGYLLGEEQKVKIHNQIKGIK